MSEHDNGLDFAKRLSDALLKVRPLGGSEMFVKRNNKYYADPDYCGGQSVVTTDPITKKVTARRDLLPATGPVILCEIHSYPWTDCEYRRKWRKVATACGIPKNVWNMDSRSGAISEAIAAGVPLEFVRHAATHSDIAQTQEYDRIQAKATRRAMEARVESRNKPKGE